MGEVEQVIITRENSICLHTEYSHAVACQFLFYGRGTKTISRYLLSIMEIKKEKNKKTQKQKMVAYRGIFRR
jgi:hypothetical protein